MRPILLLPVWKGLYGVRIIGYSRVMNKDCRMKWKAITDFRKKSLSILRLSVMSDKKITDFRKKVFQILRLSVMSDKRITDFRIYFFKKWGE